MVPITSLTFLTCLLSFRTPVSLPDLRHPGHAPTSGPLHMLPSVHLDMYVPCFFRVSSKCYFLNQSLSDLSTENAYSSEPPSSSVPRTCHHWTYSLFSFFSLFIFLFILLHSHKKVNSTGAWICVCGSLPLCPQGMAQSLVHIRLLLNTWYKRVISDDWPFHNHHQFWAPTALLTYKNVLGF